MSDGQSMRSFSCAPRRSARILFATLAAIVASLFLTPSTALAQRRTSFDDDDIKHLLARTAFGGTQADLAFIRKKGVPKYIDRILGKARKKKAPKPKKKWEKRALKLEVEERKFPDDDELVRWWVNIMINTDRPFHEVLALFWHNHFATSQAVLGGDERPWMFRHVNLLRTEGMGNLRQLLYLVSVDWVMLDWLDGLQSRRGAINENFAREFWELFSLGADNGYTQADIEEAARCFTGFRRRTNPKKGTAWIEFDPDRHDSDDKTIFGLTVAGRSGKDAYLEYQDVVNLTIDNRDVAEYIVTKLFEYFTFQDPETTTVDELASILRQGNYEIRPVLREILLSEAFYSAQAKTGFVKNPVEYAVGFSRATGLRVATNILEARLEDAGMQPTLPPGVEGWPVGDQWLSAQAMVNRANIVQEMIRRRDYQIDTKYDIEDILPPVGERSAGEIIDHLAGLLLLELTSQERDSLIDYLDTDVDSSDTIVDDPFDATRESHIDNKVRGLLFILSQHPRYHLR